MQFSTTLHSPTPQKEFLEWHKLGEDSLNLNLLTQCKPLLNSGTIWFIFWSFCFCLKLYPMRFLFPAGIRNGNSLKVIPISWVTRKCLYSLLRSWFSQHRLAFFFLLNPNKGSTQDKWELRITGSFEFLLGPQLWELASQQNPHVWQSLNFTGRVWKMGLEGTHAQGPGSINFWVLSSLRCGNENREGWKYIQTYFWDFRNFVTVQLDRKHLLKTWKWKWSCSVVSDSATPSTVAYRAPPSMGFSILVTWKKWKC